MFYTDRQVVSHESGIQYPTTDWAYLGRRSEISTKLSTVTGIDSGVLDQTSDVHAISVAKRMSWAARRVTKRLEDRAYCLMGLFNVNMPMIYGEGKKAFTRLQEEIMKGSTDETIFAWRDDQADPSATTGLLATSPSMFSHSGDFFSYCDWEPRDPFFVTNRGLQVSLPIRLVQEDLFVGVLNCPWPDNRAGFAAIYLRRITNFETYNESREQYVRVMSDKLAFIDRRENRGRTTTFFVHQSARLPGSFQIYPEHIIQLRKGPPPGDGYKIYGIMGKDSRASLDFPDFGWIPALLPSAFRVEKRKDGIVAVVVISRADDTKFTILFGSLSDFGDVAACILEGVDESRRLREWALYFRPQPLGHIIDLEQERVRVDIEPRVVQGRKYFVADLVIEKYPTLEESDGMVLSFEGRNHQ